jgi:HK97 family phage prohead protease
MEKMNFGRGANVDMTAAERQFSLEESRQMGFDKPVILAVRRRAAATARVESHVKQFPPKNGFQASLETKKIVMTLVPYDGSLCFLGGSTYETYQKNCFKDGLENDPRCTFNHDERYILGRASAGTARFTEDAAGVHAEIDPPDTTWASDLMVSMARNDVDGSSAAFWLVDYKMEQRGDKKVRVVTQAILREGAVLAWQAYKNATAAIEDPQSQPAASAASATTTMANRLKLLALR